MSDAKEKDVSSEFSEGFQARFQARALEESHEPFHAWWYPVVVWHAIIQ